MLDHEPSVAPLKRAAVALHCLDAGIFVELGGGVPADVGGCGFTALYWLLFILAGWAVIRWADLAQDNLPAVEAPPLSSRCEWF